MFWLENVREAILDAEIVGFCGVMLCLEEMDELSLAGVD